jgi:hypothetical protein
MRLCACPTFRGITRSGWGSPSSWRSWRYWRLFEPRKPGELDRGALARLAAEATF